MSSKQAIVVYLEEKGEIQGDSEEEKMTFNYLEGGLIDSFEIIEMVMRLESDFDIQFTPANMRSEEFRTVGGLVAITDRLVTEKD